MTSCVIERNNTKRHLTRFTSEKFAYEKKYWCSRCCHYRRVEMIESNYFIKSWCVWTSLVVAASVSADSIWNEKYMEYKRKNEKKNYWSNGKLVRLAFIIWLQQQQQQRQEQSKKKNRKAKNWGGQKAERVRATMRSSPGCNDMLNYNSCTRIQKLWRRSSQSTVCARHRESERERRNEAERWRKEMMGEREKSCNYYTLSAVLHSLGNLSPRTIIPLGGTASGSKTEFTRHFCVCVIIYPQPFRSVGIH